MPPTGSTPPEPRRAAPTLALRGWRSPRSIAAAKKKLRNIETRETPIAVE